MLDLSFWSFRAKWTQTPAGHSHNFSHLALVEEGSGTAAGFATRLPITRQAIIKHLVTLEQVGLVTAREMGRERRYMPRPEGLQAVTTWIEEVSAQWDQRLAALRSYLLEKPDTSSAQEQEPNAGAKTKKDKD